MQFNYCYVDHPRATRSIEFDVSIHSNVGVTGQIFIPSLSLALEYNGKQHYVPFLMYSTHSSLLLCRHHNVETVQQRDMYKRSVCSSHGITLIVVPFWWDEKVDSVAQQIHAVRPDIHPPAGILWNNVTTIAPEMPHEKGITQHVRV